MSTNTMISTQDLQSSLAGVNYPADKQALIKRAKKNQNQNVASALQDLPDKQYESNSDVAQALGLGTDIEES